MSFNNITHNEKSMVAARTYIQLVIKYDLCCGMCLLWKQTGFIIKLYSNTQVIHLMKFVFHKVVNSLYPRNCYF